MFKKLKKYRDKAKEVKKGLQEKRKEYISKDGIDFKQWGKDLKEARKDLKDFRKENDISLIGLTPEQKEQRKKEMKLWLDVVYYALLIVGKFTPIGSVGTLILKLLSLVKLYKG